MDWQSIGSTVAKVAPVLGAAVGGPVGLIAGAAGTLISSFLGVEPDPASVAKAIQDPATLARLKELELQQISRILDWQDAQLQAELENTKSARGMAVQLAQSGNILGSVAPALVSLIVTVAFGLMLYQVLLLREEPTQAATILLGSLSAAFGAVVNFYLGSSLGSFRKDAAMRK